MHSTWHKIHASLSHSSKTHSFQKTFNDLRRLYSPVAPFTDPVALLDMLRDQSVSPDQKNRVLRALLKAAQGTAPCADVALTLVLLALWPGLDAIRRRSLRCGISTAEEAASGLLARATEAISILDMDRVTRVAATVLQNVERDMIRAHRRETRLLQVAADIEPDEIPSAGGSPDEILVQARLTKDLQVMIGADATLVIRVAVEGFSQVEVALEMGLTETAANKRYQRGIRRLRKALKKNSDPLSGSGPPGGFSLLQGDQRTHQPN